VKVFPTRPVFSSGRVPQFFFPLCYLGRVGDGPSHATEAIFLLCLFLLVLSDYENCFLFFLEVFSDASQHFLTSVFYLAVVAIRNCMSARSENSNKKDQQFEFADPEGCVRK
jgi:hypothetical protein